MEDKSKELFHALFNKINNICVAAAANRKILQEEATANSSKEELKEKLSSIVQVFERIEDSAHLLDDNLRLLYEACKADKNPQK